MSIQADLLEQYEHWARLTREEGVALRSGDWKAAAACQERKAALRTLIDQLTRAADAAWAGPVPASTPSRAQVRQKLQELIALEEANRELLARLHEMDLRREADLGLAQRHLGQVHRSYAQPPAPTWQSYS